MMGACCILPQYLWQFPSFHTRRAKLLLMPQRLHAAQHLLLRHVLDVGGDDPLIAPSVDDPTAAIAVELGGDRLLHLSAQAHRLFEDSVAVLHVHRGTECLLFFVVSFATQGCTVFASPPVLR